MLDQIAVSLIAVHLLIERRIEILSQWLDEDDDAPEWLAEERSSLCSTREHITKACRAIDEGMSDGGLAEHADPAEALMCTVSDLLHCEAHDPRHDHESESDLHH